MCIHRNNISCKKYPTKGAFHLQERMVITDPPASAEAPPFPVPPLYYAPIWSRDIRQDSRDAILGIEQPWSTLQIRCR